MLAEIDEKGRFPALIHLKIAENAVFRIKVLKKMYCTCKMFLRNILILKLLVT
jgi:hypothetical protein